MLEQGAGGNPGPSPQANLTQVTRGRLDYRLLLLGSMLPDILDKPLGTWLMADVFGNGRIFGHTLLFVLVLLGVGVYLFARSKRAGILTLALGSLAHLCLDQMWLQAETLLWPFFGWSFPKGDVSQWLEGIVRSLVSKPGVYIPELIGVFCLAIFFVDTIRRRKLRNFLRKGQAT